MQFGLSPNDCIKEAIEVFVGGHIGRILPRRPLYFRERRPHGVGVGRKEKEVHFLIFDCHRQANQADFLHRRHDRVVETGIDLRGQIEVRIHRCQGRRVILSHNRVVT